MPSARSKDTLPERQVRSLLYQHGYRFRLHDKYLPGTPDIVLKKHRAVILVHGCFWHRHTGCALAYTPKSNTEYWVPKLRRNVQRDKAIIASLGKLGWNVIVVWTCELCHPIKLAERLKQALATHGS